MPVEDYKKLTLRASLDAILGQKELQTKVETAQTIIRSLCDELDSVLLTQAKRRDDDWTGNAYELVGFQKIGNYNVHDVFKSGSRRIEFYNPQRGLVTFYFNKVAATPTTIAQVAQERAQSAGNQVIWSALGSIHLTGRGEQYDAKEHFLNATEASQEAHAKVEKYKQKGVVRTLENYQLDRVAIAVPAPAQITLLGFNLRNPFYKETVVYKNAA